MNQEAFYWKFLMEDNNASSRYPEFGTSSEMTTTMTTTTMNTNTYPRLKIDVHVMNVSSQMSDNGLPSSCLQAQCPSAMSVPSGGTELSSWSMGPTLVETAMSPPMHVTHETRSLATISPSMSRSSSSNVTHGTHVTPSSCYHTPSKTPGVGKLTTGEAGSMTTTSSPNSLRQRRLKNQSSLKLALNEVKGSGLETFLSMERGLSMLTTGGGGGGSMEFISPMKEGDKPVMDQDFDLNSDRFVWDGNLMIELNEAYRRDLNSNDLREDRKLGHGSSGDVTKVTHIPTGRVMAKKCVRLEPKQTSQQQILRELQVLHECHSPYIVSFYGAFFTTDGSINLCMEYMDLGSLDSICHELGGIPELVMGKIALSILRGLIYLYDGFRIMHRDIKPSNILLNSKGEVKLCDFGVSGNLVNSVANSFVGTSAYMAPERIQGCKYTIHSDIWSFGLSLIELTTGVFPIPEAMSVFELMQEIVRSPAPSLPKGLYSPEYEDFIAKCLTKECDQRPLPIDLLHHPFILRAAREDFDMRSFCGYVIVSRRQRKYDKLLSNSGQETDVSIVKNG